jgi:hypothetical protein
VSQVSTAFDSESQGPSESSEAFLTRKSQLYSRLYPDAPEMTEALIPLLIDQLQGSLKPHPLATRPKAIDELQ